jgi:hypothetical protein
MDELSKITLPAMIGLIVMLVTVSREVPRVRLFPLLQSDWWLLEFIV